MCSFSWSLRLAPSTADIWAQVLESAGRREGITCLLQPIAYNVSTRRNAVLFFINFDRYLYCINLYQVPEKSHAIDALQVHLDGAFENLIKKINTVCIVFVDPFSVLTDSILSKERIL